jgi:hypothetical protein
LHHTPTDIGTEAGELPGNNGGGSGNDILVSFDHDKVSGRRADKVKARVLERKKAWKSDKPTAGLNPNAPIFHMKRPVAQQQQSVRGGRGRPLTAAHNASAPHAATDMQLPAQQQQSVRGGRGRPLTAAHNASAPHAATDMQLPEQQQQQLIRGGRGRPLNVAHNATAPHAAAYMRLQMAQEQQQEMAVMEELWLR